MGKTDVVCSSPWKLKKKHHIIYNPSQKKVFSHSSHSISLKLDSGKFPHSQKSTTLRMQSNEDGLNHCLEKEAHGLLLLVSLLTSKASSALSKPFGSRDPSKWRLLSLLVLFHQYGSNFSSEKVFFFFFLNHQPQRKHQPGNWCYAGPKIDIVGCFRITRLGLWIPLKTAGINYIFRRVHEYWSTFENAMRINNIKVAWQN